MAMLTPDFVASHEDLGRPERWKDPDEFGGVPLRNLIGEHRRKAAMELCIVRKPHELPRRDNSSHKMNPDASTL